jgi:4-hydroxy-2-oxoheptanedioate aldolase
MGIRGQPASPGTGAATVPDEIGDRRTTPAPAPDHAGGASVTIAGSTRTTTEPLAMELPVNRFKHALAAGDAQIGLWCSLSSHYTVELVAGAGYDWLLIDMEHAPNDLESVLTQLQAAAAYPTHPIVRVPWNDVVTIKRVLDLGAQTILIPMINSVEEARAAVSYCRYPPGGVRGVGGTTRATRFARIRQYPQKVERELCILLQVETEPALEQLEAIAAVDGVDGIFIGPADLHASFGQVGERHHPEVWPRIEDAIRRIRACGKAPGFLTGDEPDARRILEIGGQFVAVGSDSGLLASAADSLCRRFLKPAG